MTIILTRLNEKMEIDPVTAAFVIGGIALFVNQRIANYGYNRAIREAKLALIIVVIVIVIIIILYFLIKKIWLYAKSKKSYEKSFKIEEKAITKEEDSESIEIEEPKEELPQIEEECITESPENEEECKPKPKKAKIAQRKNITIDLDENKRFFRHKELKLEEVEYLLAKGYRISEHRSLSSNKREKYLLKPRFNENDNHCYFVYAIAEFLESKRIIVSLFATVKPDLTFMIDGIRYAIEVETGNKINKDKKLIINKAEYMKNNFDYWFFVVINRNFVKRYRKIGKTVDIRYLSTSLKKLVN